VVPVIEAVAHRVLVEIKSVWNGLPFLGEMSVNQSENHQKQDLKGFK
jgi:hypothetical protein